MLVYTKTPRVRTFKAFKSANEATRFVRGVGERLISFRYGHNRYIVNYFAR